MSSELAIREEHAVGTISGFEMKPRNLEEAMHFCEIMAESELVPKDYIRKPGNIMVAIQLGSELGLTPMRALRCIAVVNGRASLWGDEMLAMVLASPICEYVNESDSSEKEGVCKVKRKGHPEHVARFTLEDAKRAGLLGKQGPWTQHTGRMLKLRARGFALRDKFADVLAGLITTEEALDLPSETPQAVPAIEQPKSLKDKLKAQLQEPEVSGADEGASGAVPPAPVTEPAVEPGATPPPAGAPSMTDDDNPASDYCARIRTAHTAKDVQAIWAQVPEELQQDVYGDYTNKMKDLARKK